MIKKYTSNLVKKGLSKIIESGSQYARNTALRSSWTNWIPFLGFRHVPRVVATGSLMAKQSISKAEVYKKSARAFAGKVRPEIKIIKTNIKNKKITGVDMSNIEEWENKLTQKAKDVAGSVKDMYQHKKSETWKALKTPTAEFGMMGVDTTAVLKTSYEKMIEHEAQYLASRNLFQTTLKSNLAVITMPTLVSTVAGLTVGQKLRKKAQEINRGYK